MIVAARGRLRPSVALLAMLLAGAVLAPPAAAAPPTLLNLSQAEGKIHAEWDLPPDGEADEIEVSLHPDVKSDGSFVSTVQSDSFDDPDATEWTSGRLKGGTYYVHVSGFDLNCENCDVEEWSNVLSVVVLQVFPKPGNYKGPAGDFGDARIKFYLTKDLTRVRNLTARYILTCPVGALRAKLHWKSVRVRNGKFTARKRLRGRGFRAYASVKGTLDPPRRATGRLKANARLRGIGKCRLFGASRRGYAWHAKRR